MLPSNMWARDRNTLWAPPSHSSLTRRSKLTSLAQETTLQREVLARRRSPPTGLERSRDKISPSRNRLLTRLLQDSTIPTFQLLSLRLQDGRLVQTQERAMCIETRRSSHQPTLTTFLLELWRDPRFTCMPRQTRLIKI